MMEGGVSINTYSVNKIVIIYSYGVFLLGVAGLVGFIYGVIGNTSNWWLALLGTLALVGWFQILKAYPKEVIVSEEKILFVMKFGNKVEMATEGLKIEEISKNYVFSMPNQSGKYIYVHKDSTPWELENIFKDQLS